MIIRLLETIALMVIMAFFIGFNLDNKCDVNVLFYTFKSVPCFITILVSFVLGVFFTIPFAFFAKKKTSKTVSKDNLKEKKSFSLKKDKNKKQNDSLTNSTNTNVQTSSVTTSSQESNSNTTVTENKTSTEAK